MYKKSILVCAFLSLFIHLFSQVKEILIYHPIQTDKSGKIISWYSEDPGKSYNHVINLVWNFWDYMRKDMNGLPYYMNHQVWNPNFNDPVVLVVTSLQWLFPPGPCYILIQGMRGSKRI